MVEATVSKGSKGNVLVKGVEAHVDIPIPAALAAVVGGSKAQPEPATDTRGPLKPEKPIKRAGLLAIAAAAVLAACSGSTPAGPSESIPDTGALADVASDNPTVAADTAAESQVDVSADSGVAPLSDSSAADSASPVDSGSPADVPASMDSGSAPVDAGAPTDTGIPFYTDDAGHVYSSAPQPIGGCVPGASGLPIVSRLTYQEPANIVHYSLILPRVGDPDGTSYLRTEFSVGDVLEMGTTGDSYTLNSFYLQPLRVRDTHGLTTDLDFAIEEQVSTSSFLCGAVDGYFSLNLLGGSAQNFVAHTTDYFGNSVTVSVNQFVGMVSGGRVNLTANLANSLPTSLAVRAAAARRDAGADVSSD